jgi:hypothetical protein
MDHDVKREGTKEGAGASVRLAPSLRSATGVGQRLANDETILLVALRERNRSSLT